MKYIKKYWWILVIIAIIIYFIVSRNYLHFYSKQSLLKMYLKQRGMKLEDFTEEGKKIYLAMTKKELINGIKEASKKPVYNDPNP